MGEVSQDRIRSAFEQYRHTEYSGIVQGFQDLVNYTKTSTEANGHRSSKDFNSMLESKQEIVESLANLHSWDQTTISAIESLKRQMVIDAKGYQQIMDTFHTGPDVLVQGMVAEAVFKRLWRRSTSYATGNEKPEEYEVIQDSEVDAVGIDFMGTIDYDDKNYFVCAQIKANSKYPAGEIRMVDLTPVEVSQQYRSAEDQAILENVKLGEEDVIRINNTALRAFRKEDNRPGFKVKTVLVVIGVRVPGDDFTGWKKIMEGADQQAGHLYFANKLDEILSGEKTEETQEIEERLWHEGIFSEIPTSRPLRYSDKEAKYEGYARRYPTDESNSDFGPLFKGQKIETKQKPRRKRRF